eukprot:TRINITY_DN19038_c0_g1_i1.p1 TRINITY_DN19038_c0_g1~~TRINITY_DN19038_c0_g1_i1.p1  ORF type:complete len:322 (+),score=72.49 TRINITY_DN19038_c0_g1_i1:106-1071(+)
MAAEVAPPKMPVSVPDDFEVDKEARYVGTVTDYSKWRGFGHIELDQKGVVPGDSVFVHWKNIQTDDRFPRLHQGLQVELGLMISKNWRGWQSVRSVKAKTVTLPGGAMVNIQDAMDAEKKSFVGAQNTRYTGTLKFFDAMRGFGWITIDEGFNFGDDAVPAEIKVEGTEMSCGGQRYPRSRLEKLNVEFGIVKNKKGDAYLAYNVTLPGGVLFKQENLEHRQKLGDQKYAGKVHWYSWRQGWGQILPADVSSLPPVVSQKLDEAVAAAAAKAKSDAPPEKLVYFRKTDAPWGVKLEVGSEVTFSLYTDDKGAGACDIALSA